MCPELVAVIIHWNKLVWWPVLTAVGFNHATVKQRTLVPEEDNYSLCSLTFRAKWIWLPTLLFPAAEKHKVWGVMVFSPRYFPKELASLLILPSKEIPNFNKQTFFVFKLLDTFQDYWPVRRWWITISLLCCIQLLLDFIYNMHYSKAQVWITFIIKKNLDNTCKKKINNTRSNACGYFAAIIFPNSNLFKTKRFKFSLTGICSVFLKELQEQVWGLCVYLCKQYLLEYSIIHKII